MEEVSRWASEQQQVALALPHLEAPRHLVLGASQTGLMPDIPKDEHPWLRRVDDLRSEKASWTACCPGSCAEELSQTYWLRFPRLAASWRTVSSRRRWLLADIYCRLEIQSTNDLLLSARR